MKIEAFNKQSSEQTLRLNLKTLSNGTVVLEAVDVDGDCRLQGSILVISDAGIELMGSVGDFGLPLTHVGTVVTKGL